jgi:hypothetical protein
MSHSLCVMGVYDEVKMTVPMIVRYVHNDKIKEKRNSQGLAQSVTSKLSLSHHPCLKDDIYYTKPAYKK